MVEQSDSDTSIGGVARGQDPSGDVSEAQGESRTHGILKSSQMSEALEKNETQLPSSLQLPAHVLARSDMSDGNNTTSRISALISQNNPRVNRRVSFAPDVTLHSFEFVPEKKSTFREPRRKAPEPIMTSTQNDSVMESQEVDPSPVEFAEPQAAATSDQNTKPATEKYQAVFSQEDSMDITQLFSRYSKKQEDEETMDFTTIQNEPKSSKPADDSMDFTEIGLAKMQDEGITMELTTVSEQVPIPRDNNTSSAQQGKRRKLNENNDYLGSPVGDRSAAAVHSVVHKVQEEDEDSKKDEGEDMELTMNEKMSPIKLKGVQTEDETRPENNAHSLVEFLEQTGINFLIDTELIEKRKTHIIFELIELEKTRKFRINQLYTTLYFQTPILEMNAFICKELMRRISQSNTQFEDLNKQMSTSFPQPLLFSEYFNSSEEMKQLLNQQIHLVKSFSKLKAKKSWYEWRIQHLSGIKTVLVENLQILKEEVDKVKHDLTKIQDSKVRAEKLRDSIRREIKLLKELPSDVYESETRLADKVRFETLRQELNSNLVAIDESTDLINELENIKAKISQVNNDLMIIKREITSLQKTGLQNAPKSSFTSYYISKLRNRLETLGSISGLKFVKLHKSELTIKIVQLTPALEITVNLDKPQEDYVPLVKISGEHSKDEFFKYFLQLVVKTARLDQSQDSLLDIFLSIRKVVPLLKQYLILKMLFPVRILQRGDSSYSLQIEDCDIKSKSKVLYELRLEDFSTAVRDKDSKVYLKAIVNPTQENSFSNLSTRFFRKATKVLPWMEQDRCEVTFSSI